MSLKYLTPIQLILSISVLLYSYGVTAETFFIDNQNGKDLNTGTSEENSWKSLDKVNAVNFSPGDTILFKRNNKWRGTLIVNSSGLEGKPITYSAYGEGANPVIMRTTEYADWTLVKNKKTLDEKTKIWTGQIKGLVNSWGLVKDKLRTPSLKQYSKHNISSLPDGYFYAPLNKSVFYFRNDSGNPGKLEIGAREYAILIKDRSHIIIDSIDTFGPGGRYNNGSSTGFRSIEITGSSNKVHIKNLTVSHSDSIAISSNYTTSNITYSNITSHNNGGTGIYMNSQGGEIVNCKIYDNGRLLTDTGDRGGIGSYKGSNLLIKNNQVFRNGSDNDYSDFEISIVSTGKVTIEKNYVHDCLQGCIQIADGGDNSTIAYNIISNYGSVTAKAPSPGIYSGIRIGGGDGGAKNVMIINNVIHGGRQSLKSREAALYIGWFDSPNLLVQNNIFSDNLNKNIYVRKKASLGNIIFTNNIFSSDNKHININWKDIDMYILDDWKNKTGHGKNSFSTSGIFKNQSNKFIFTSDFYVNNKSIAIENGVNVHQNSDFNNTPIPVGKKPNIGVFE